MLRGSSFFFCMLFWTLAVASSAFASKRISLCERSLLSLADLSPSEVAAVELLNKRVLGTKTKTLPSKVDHIRLETRGIPLSVEELNYDSSTVFRHYAKSPEERDQIIQSQTLVAGRTPYVHMEEEHFREEFPDLVGIFFTSVGESPRRVGVWDSYYVDFQLSPGTGALSLERGIYLVPGQPKEFKLQIKVINSPAPQPK